MGVQRTGTTSIQKAMAESRGKLKSKGVLYPWLFGRHNHVKIAWDIYNGKLKAEQIIEAVKQKEDFRTSKVILSAEGFCFLKDFSFISELDRDYEVKVIIYLKEQVSWLESWYNQHIKWPWKKKYSSSSPEHFIECMDDFYWINYAAMLEKIEQYVSKENIYLEVLGAGGVNNTVEDFFHKTGIQAAWLNPYEEVKNASLTKAQLDILRQIDIKPLKGPSRNKIIKALRDMDIDEEDGSKTVFDATQTLKIQEMFNESNHYVARRYFGKDELFTLDVSKLRAPVKISEDKIHKTYLPEVVRRVADM